MTYANMPLIIPTLATGYLFAIYLLLVLAQRNSKETDLNVDPNSKRLHKQEAPVTGGTNSRNFEF